MAKKLFGIDIAGIVADSLPGMFSGVLTQKTPGTRTPGNLGGGTNPTSTSYAFKGFASTFDMEQKDALVRGASHTILIIAKTLQGGTIEPRPQDTIVLTDDPQLGSKTCTIVENGVERDPASATWTCHVKAV
jgi:hypothetical protein